MSGAFAAKMRAGRTVALVALAGASLAACATPGGPAPVAVTRPLAARPSSPPRTAQQPAPHGPLRGTMKPYQVNGVWYEPREQPDYDETGYASWYGEAFHNRRTANGEVFDMDAPSAAHKTLPLPSLVDVTNLETGRTIRLRVNDRGPFVAGRILDLSRQAAVELGVLQKGLARVRVRYVGPADLARPQDGLRYAQAAAPPPAPVAAPPPRRPAVRIQAAAFADRANAERAAQRLAMEGQATVEPLDRGDQTLWRVVVACDGDDALARVAAAGFPDAHLVQP